MSKIVKVEFEGELMQFNNDGWFNATAAAKKFGKRPVDWLRLDEANDYVEAVSDYLKCEPKSLLKTRKGNNGGTWLHPDLAVVFARWLDVRFAVWCDQQIKTIIHGKPEQTDWSRVRHEAAATYKVMSAMLDMKRQLDGKETKPHHYANEAKLVNWALTGEYKPLDREVLSTDDLDILAKLEELNSLLIANNISRDERKEKLLLVVCDKRKKLG